MGRSQRRYSAIQAENALAEIGEKAADARRIAQALTPDAPRLYRDSGEIHAAVARMLIRGENA